MSRDPIRAVVIGASAGAVQVLLEILPALPPTFPVPIFIVVHIPPDRTNALTTLFADRCGLTVKEAEDKETPVPGTVYFAPADYHLLIEQDGRVALAMDEPVHHSRPAIDVLFETAADAFGPDLVAIVLTGANEDGGAGLLAVGEAGCLTLVEEPMSASSSTMPAAALAAWPQARAQDVPGILAYLQTLVAP